MTVIMDPARWRRLQDLFHHAAELPAPERVAYLEAAAPDDDALRAEAAALLRALDSEAANVANVIDRAIRSVDDAPRGAWRGRRIGPYVVEDDLGRGGMGIVLLARRADRQFERTVAIKVVSAAAGADMASRFRAERQMLAVLDHPHIARLLDGGELDDGTPYLVMEHVDGVAIDRYADEHRLTIRERLDLFRDVCAAVHYAHKNLIVHRDLKPDNILVTPDGVPKLLDFGIAKLLEPERLPGGVFETRTVMRALTPAYASPEQVRGEPVTTASDVYSLGVLLYELLSGTRPYRIPTTNPAEIERVVCGTEPGRPSAVSAVAMDAEGVAAARSTRPERLRRDLGGDLDTIALMALRKEPDRRYASVEQMSEDIRRHLRGLPVMARPDTTHYRVSKFVRRNRGLVIGVAGAFAILAAGLAASLWQHRVAVDAREAERRQRERAEVHSAEARWQAYVSAIAAAESSIRLSQIGDARRRLDDAPAELRGWEWRHLQRRLDRSLYARPAHRDIVTAIRFTPRGDAFLCASIDATISWWHTETGDSIARWPPLASGIESAEIAPDGRTVAAGCSDGTVVVMDAETGERITSLKGYAWANVAFHPDGSRLLGAFRDGSVTVWSTETFLPVRSIAGETPYARARYTPDGRTVVLAGADGAVRLLDAHTLSTRARMTGHARRIMSMDISRDGARMVTGSMDRSARVWDLAARREVSVFRGHEATVAGVAFDAPGRHVVSTGADRQILRWDAATAVQQAEYRGGGEDGYSLAFSLDGTRFMTGSWAGWVRAWDVRTDDVQTLRVPELPYMVLPVHDARTSPDGKLRACASERGHAELWDAQTGAYLGVFAARTGEVTRQVVFAPDGERLFLADVSGEVTVFDVATRTPAATMAATGRGIVSLDVSPDGATLLVTSEDSTVVVRDAATLETVRAFEPTNGAVARACFHPDGGAVIAACSDGTIWVRGVSDGEPVTELRAGASAVTGFACDADGKHIVAISDDDTLRLWDVTASRVIERRSLARRNALSIRVSTDGTRIAVGGDDQIVRVLDAVTLREVARLHGHVGRILSLHFDPLRDAFVSSSHDGTIRVWDAADGVPE